MSQPRALEQLKEILEWEYELKNKKPQREPMLGLATTRELLGELETRMRVTQNSLAGRDLGTQCQAALMNLDRGVLDYRTSNGST